MADITFTFTNPLPDGTQITDVAWYLNNTTKKEIKMGPIKSIDNTTKTIVVDAKIGVVPPGSSDFIFYVKNPIAGTGQLKGYYAEVQFTNSSTDYAELFSVGTQIFESSK